MSTTLVMSDFWEGDVVPNDQQEDESDLVGRIDYSSVVSMTADWTVETINNQVSKSNIDLDPSFQRRAAWDNTRKSRLIESVIVGMPVPNIVLADNRSKKGQFIVIDGKQRLLAIHEFLNDRFKLEGLDIRVDLNGFSYSELNPDDKTSLENSTIRSTVIKNWVDENFLYALFFRLNSGSLQLSPQELRKAVVGGRLLDEIEKYILSSDKFHKVFGETPDRRMRDSELVLRFIAFEQRFQNYRGNLKPFLDDIVRDYESNWDTLLPDLQNSFARLDMALDITFKIFGENSFKKAITGGYERRMNRAVFDVLARTFGDLHLGPLYVSDPTLVQDLFRDVCGDVAFKQAIERSTKGLEATRFRISIWSKKLASAFGRNYNETDLRIE